MFIILAGCMGSLSFTNSQKCKKYVDRFIGGRIYFFLMHIFPTESSVLYFNGMVYPNFAYYIEDIV